MLVVTVIIAAVVGAFSSGMIGTKEKPQQVTFTASVDNVSIYFDHMGGDALSLEDLRIDLDQKDSRISITNDTIDRDFEGNNLSRKGTPGDLIRAGDTIVLKGGGNSSNIKFQIKDGSPITIEHDKILTWTIISRSSGGILARGSLTL